MVHALDFFSVYGALAIQLSVMIIGNVCTVWLMFRLSEKFNNRHGKKIILLGGLLLGLIMFVSVFVFDHILESLL